MTQIPSDGENSPLPAQDSPVGGNPSGMPPSGYPQCNPETYGGWERTPVSSGIPAAASLSTTTDLSAAAQAPRATLAGSTNESFRGIFE